MIKNLSPKYDLENATDCMEALRDMSGLVFACVEADGDQFRCVSYWDIKGHPVKGQRYVPNFLASAPNNTPAPLTEATLAQITLDSKTNFECPICRNRGICAHYDRAPGWEKDCAGNFFEPPKPSIPEIRSYEHP